MKSMFDLPDGVDGLIPVMCCWNDDNGNFSGNLVKLDLHDAIEIETNFVNDNFEPDGIDCELRPGVLVITGEEFPFSHHRTWVGNIFWDLIWMAPEDTLRLLNKLQATKHFGIEQGVLELFDHWDTGKPFNEKHLSVIVDGAREFRL